MIKNLLLSLLILSIFGQLKAQIPSYVPTSGLVGWWPFNGNANDESGNGNNGTVNGATLTTDRFGNANSAYSFDGIGNEISIPVNNLPLGNDSRTMSFWGKYNSANALQVQQQLVGYGPTVANQRFSIVYSPNYSNHISVIGESNDFDESSFTMDVNWHHYAVNFNGSLASLFIDGQLVAQANKNYSTANTNLFIGFNGNTSHWGGEFFNGFLDDIAIWNRALTAAEITALYTNTPPPTVTISSSNATICVGTSSTLTATASSSNTCSNLTGSLATGLVGYWPFCGNANDESGIGNNGTVNGATLTTDRFGNANSAYSFDGVDDYISLTNSLPNTSTFTISAWVHHTKGANYSGILSDADTSPGNDLFYNMNNQSIGVKADKNGSILFRCPLPEVGYNPLPLANSLNLGNQWKHIVLSITSSETNLYVNSTLVTTLNIGGSNVGNHALNPVFGKITDGGYSIQFFGGNLDDVAIWNRALTAAEIQELYTAGQTTYSWSTGATTPSISVSPTTTTTYTCTVTDANGNSCSEDVTITVVDNPVVSTPTSAAYCASANNASALSVVATGGINNAYTYQWYVNGSNNNTGGVAISNATNSTYTPPTSVASTSFYYCTVNPGTGCSSTSATATVQIVNGPAFSSQPLASQTICQGASIAALNFNYTGGYGLPTYQWFANTTNSNFNGTPISGANSAVFNPNPNVLGVTYYYCVINFDSSYGCDILTTNPAEVSIIANPVFTSTPLASQTLCLGASPQTLSVATSGGYGPSTYQWYIVANGNYTPIIGANSLDYAPSANNPVGTYNYAVSMSQTSSGCFTGFSNTATVNVVAQPTISAPIGGVYCQNTSGANAITVTVTGGNGTSNYQWYQNTINSNTGGTPIAQANSNTYTPDISNLSTLYYYCVVNQNTGCSANSAVATVVTNPIPVLTSQPTALQTICSGATATVLSVSYNGGVGTPQYQWYSNTNNSSNGGTPISGANSNSYTPIASTNLGSNYYYCVVSLSNTSCPSLVSNAATILIVDNPIVNGPSSAAYCQSNSSAQPLSVVAIGGSSTNYNYQWYSNTTNNNTGGTAILGANTASYTPLLGSNTSYYYCVVTQSGGCVTNSAVSTIDILSAPNITQQVLSGQTVCLGGSAQLLEISSAGGVGAPTYQWFSNTTPSLVGASAISGATAASYTPVAPGTASSTYYYCQVSFVPSTNCPTLTSNFSTLSVIPDPILSAPMSATYCQNSPSIVALNSTASGGINSSYTYQWYSNTSNSNIGGTAIPGANTANFLPSVATIGTTYYYCEVTQGSGCNASSSVAEININVSASMSLQPIAVQNVCLGQSTQLLSVGVNASNYPVNYQWYSNSSNSTIGGVQISGANSASFLPPNNIFGTTYYYCIATVANGGCGVLTSTSAEVNIVTLPTVIGLPNLSTCCQDPTAPIAFTGSANNYSWTATASSPLLTGYNNTGTGDLPPLTLTNNSTTPQNVVFMVTPSNAGCSGTPVQFSINVMPCLSVNTPTDQYFCAGEIVGAYVFTGVGTSFAWNNNNPSIGTLNTGNNFVPNFTAVNTSTTTQVAAITVTPQFQGCAGAAQSFNITVYPLPVVEAGADQAVCAGSAVTLSATGATTYVWDNGVIDNQSFVPNISATYTVIGTDQNGCQQTDQLTVVVNQATTSTLNITACDTYQLNGQTYTQSGTYTQQTSNINGCDSTITLNLTMNYSPNTPAIYVQNQVNLSTDLVAGLTYQWISCTDLTDIAGQTAITFNPTVNNVYAVVVTNSCGSDTSLCMSITTIGMEEAQLAEQFLVYPNPNNGNFIVKVPEEIINEELVIYDINGKLLSKIRLFNIVNEIDLASLSNGCYWIQISGNTPIQIIKQ